MRLYCKMQTEEESVLLVQQVRKKTGPTLCLSSLRELAQVAWVLKYWWAERLSYHPGPDSGI